MAKSPTTETNLNSLLLWRKDFVPWAGMVPSPKALKFGEHEGRLSSAATIGALYTDLGDKDQAFQWLNTAYQERDYWLVGLRTNFSSTPYVPTHGFVEMVYRVGLPR
jgi:hypothetical protein